MLKFNQRTLYFKDTDSIDSNIKKLNNNISEIHTDIHSLVNQKIDTFFGVTYDTVFTVLFTILIFLIGVIIDRWNRRNIEKKELNKLKNYFNSQFEELKTSIIPGLIKAYRKSYQEIITLDNGLQTTPPKILTKTYDRLANLESPLLFKTFNNSSDYNEAFSQIDLLQKLMNEIDNYHSLSLARSSGIRNILAELDSKYITKLVEFLESERKNNPNYEDNITYIKINHYVIYYHENITGGRNLTKYYKEVIRPIQYYLVKETNLFRTDERCKEIAELGRQISHRYNELRLLFIEIRLQYRTFSQTFSKTKDRLDQLNTK